jgi:hypothetical protein
LVRGEELVVRQQHCGSGERVDLVPEPADLRRMQLRPRIERVELIAGTAVEVACVHRQELPAVVRGPQAEVCRELARTGNSGVHRGEGVVEAVAERVVVVVAGEGEDRYALAGAQRLVEHLRDHVGVVDLALARSGRVVNVSEMNDRRRLELDHQIAQERLGIGEPGSPVADDPDHGVVRQPPVDHAVVDVPAALNGPVVVLEHAAVLRVISSERGGAGGKPHRVCVAVLTELDVGALRVTFDQRHALDKPEMGEVSGGLPVVVGIGLKSGVAAARDHRLHVVVRGDRQRMAEHIRHRRLAPDVTARGLGNSRLPQRQVSIMHSYESRVGHGDSISLPRTIPGPRLEPIDVWVTTA